MAPFLFIIGLLGTLVFFIKLLVSVIRKKNKRGNFIGLAVCFVLFTFGVSNLPESNSKSTSASPNPVPTATVSGTSNVLTEENSPFHPDEAEITTIEYLSLHQKQEDYTGKYVRIAGVLSSIGNNIMGVTYGTFKNGFSGITDCIYINFDQNATGLENLSEGTVVAIIGRVGTLTAGSLNLDNAYIDASVTDPAQLITSLKEASFDVEVKATDLLNAYDKNEISADNEYKDKTLKVYGVIRDIGKDITDSAYITLQNEDDKYSIISVQCYFESEEELLTLATQQLLTPWQMVSRWFLIKT